MLPPKLRPLALMLVVLAPVALGQTPAAGPAPVAAPQVQQAAPAADTAPAADAAAVAPSAPATDAVPAAQAAPAAGEDTDPAAAEEAATEEELAEEGMGGPPKLPAGFTGITGRVVDARTKEAIIEATVKVVSGAQKQVLTDLDGYYVLKLEPGTYALRVFEGVYQGRRIQNVVVTEGKATKLDVALSPDAGAVQEVVVEVKADRRSASALLQERKKAAAVSDAVSAQEIARTPDASAGDAVKRVVSATVVGGKYVLLRGLGGRYSTTLLNGALLPSPEPDEPSVPLDIFPTNLLANLNVIKSYTAELPGSFGGGTLQIETNSYPSKFEVQPRISLSGDSVSTFHRRYANPGSTLDALGVTDASRSLPASVPTDHAVSRAGGMTEEQANEVGKTFAPVWDARRARSLPNGSLGLSVGDTLRFGNRRFGYLVAGNYGRGEQILRGTFGRTRFEGGTQGYAEQGSSDVGIGTTNISGLANASYQFNQDNELTFFTLLTRNTESRAERVGGFSNAENEVFDGTRLQYVSRLLSFNQLRGFHRLGILNDAELDWQGNFSHVDRTEPDTRDTTYYVDSELDRSRFKSQTSSGIRFFSGLTENSAGGSLNLTVPLASVRLKVGGLAQLSLREFGARRFRYFYEGGADPSTVFLPPEQLLSPDYIGSSIRFEESTNRSDYYDGLLGIYAGYLAADARVTDSLRLVGGARYEYSQQSVTLPQNAIATGGIAEGGFKRYSDLLPTANVIYALTDKVNLRAGYSYTLARPTFREITPFLFYDFVRRRAVSGNPDLVETRIHNLDLRAEWFPEEGEVMAATVFAKRFLSPIERVFTNGTGQSVQFKNADAAQLYGVELEARTSLRRVTQALSDFRLAANVTLIRSSIELGSQKGVQTHAARPLQGQSPYVLNVNLGYEKPEAGLELGLLYNVYGPRISDVGVQGLDDVYEQPFHRVDLVGSYKLGTGPQLKLTAGNLLNSSVVLRQGGLDVQKYQPGMSFSAQLAWSL